MRLWRALLLAVLLGCVSACSNEAEPRRDPVSVALDPEKAGPYAVGTKRFELSVHSARTLPVQLWYPAVSSAGAEARQGHPFADIEPAGARHDALARLVAEAPEGCTSRTLHAAIDAPARERSAPWPVILFSHCHHCARYSQLSVAERLASWGFVVAAPDHEENTLYDQLAGTASRLTPEFLLVRAQDVRDVLDALLSGHDGLPAALRGRLDPARVGMFGHSFGSITTGLVLQSDPRVRAGVMLAAPPENPLLPGVTLANLTQPGFFVLAEEDNSITALGNTLIQQNFASYPAEAWLLTLRDAGHWSFSDIAGITEQHAPGCGEAKRQTDPTQTFAYMDNQLAREVAQAYVTAFLAAQLQGDAAGAAYLEQAKPEGVVTLEHRSPDR